MTETASTIDLEEEEESHLVQKESQQKALAANNNDKKETTTTTNVVVAQDNKQDNDTKKEKNNDDNKQNDVKEKEEEKRDDVEEVMPLDRGEASLDLESNNNNNDLLKDVELQSDEDDDEFDDETMPIISSSKKSTAKMEPLEIATNDDDDDDGLLNDDDLEALLNNAQEEKEKRKQHQDSLLQNATKMGCIPVRQRGNATFCCGNSTSWGVVGPHWFGPLIVLGIISAASQHFIYKSLSVGPVTTVICILYTVVTTFTLLDTSLRNPGIVLKARPPPDTDLTDWRMCDFCNALQPPDGIHCPDCNVCVMGYDHHCVWMGTCVGKQNYKQFIRFNLSWLTYLMFAILWVSFIGPILAGKGYTL